MDRELIGPCLDELAAAGGVVRELVPGEGGELLPAVYLVAFHRAEQSLAAGLLALLNSRQERLPAFAAVDWGKALLWLHARTGQDLAPGQQEAAQLALTQKVAVLTGGPSCGKSFTVRSIVELATAKDATVMLVAPTGRAAKRLAELTGHDASTVHRLLELQPGGDPKYDRDHPLDADLVVVDEASMMDVILANKLVKGIGPVMAERMVAHFGAGILAVIETEPGRLIEVHGLGPKRTKKIAEAWEEQKAIKEVMVFLSGVGVSTSLAVPSWLASERAAYAQVTVCVSTRSV